MPTTLASPSVLHEQRGALVDPHPQLVGMGQHEREQPVLALPLHEVLVDDRAREQAQAGPRLDLGGVDHREVAVARDHARRHDRGAGAGAREDDTLPVALAEDLEQPRVGEQHVHDAALVASREEDRRGRAELLEQARVLRGIQRRSQRGHLALTRTMGLQVFLERDSQLSAGSELAQDTTSRRDEGPPAHSIIREGGRGPAAAHDHEPLLRPGGAGEREERE